MGTYSGSRNLQTAVKEIATLTSSVSKGELLSYDSIRKTVAAMKQNIVSDSAVTSFERYYEQLNNSMRRYYWYATEVPSTPNFHIGVDMGEKMRGDRTNLIIFDEYKGAKKMGLYQENVDQAAESTYCENKKHQKKPMSPVLESLVDFAERTGSAESLNLVNRRRADRLEEENHTLKSQLEEYKTYAARLEKESKDYYSRLYDATTELRRIRDRTRAAAAKKRAAAKPKKTVKKSK